MQASTNLPVLEYRTACRELLAADEVDETQVALVAAADLCNRLHNTRIPKEKK